VVKNTDISNDPEALVGEPEEDGVWSLYFRRGLDDKLTKQWQSLTVKLMEVSLNKEHDVVTWALEKDGCFSTKSLYRQSHIVLPFPFELKGLSTLEAFVSWMEI
jgi:hypothetical protein